jgi:hypothetical protein
MERALSRTMDHLELLEQRAVDQELKLRLLLLSQEERLRLLSPPLAVPSTPSPPPLPEPPSPVEEWQPPQVHRPEILDLPEPEPMPPAEDQLLSLLGSKTTPSSSSSSVA